MTTNTMINFYEPLLYKSTKIQYGYSIINHRVTFDIVSGNKYFRNMIVTIAIDVPAQNKLEPLIVLINSENKQSKNLTFDIIDHRINYLDGDGHCQHIFTFKIYRIRKTYLTKKIIMTFDNVDEFSIIDLHIDNVKLRSMYSL